MSTPRRWLELRVKGPSEQEDDSLLAEGLLLLGGRAVEERDGWYLTHLEEPAELSSFLARARETLEALSGLSSVELEHRWQVVALEGDDLACEALEEDLERNGVGARVRIVQGWADEPTLAALAPWNGVLANIEWSRLRPLLPGLRQVLAPGGRLVFSGILDHELGEVRSLAAEVGLAVAPVDQDGEWRSILLEDRPDLEDRPG